MSIFNTSCERPSKEAKIKMVLTGSVTRSVWMKKESSGRSV